MERSDITFVLKSLLRIGLHVILFLVFYLITDRCYFFLQSFLIDSFSKVAYVNSIDATKDAFVDILIFTVGCYFTNFGIIKRLQLKEIEILILLATDLICLFASNLLMITYYNLFSRQGIDIDIRSLNNVSVIIVLIFVKDWIFIRLRNREKIPV
ncbi:hypothetical protein ACFFGT_03435 [Mucilaginibacter angelicae]|uniref:Uncharacterized protein n=1 Tax=Mucilaginibacter angelicae TaxID=869718 RepID=A0ABV6L0K2_9SPHI